MRERVIGQSQGSDRGTLSVARPGLESRLQPDLAVAYRVLCALVLEFACHKQHKCTVDNGHENSLPQRTEAGIGIKV